MSDSGNLALLAEDENAPRMVAATDCLARQFSTNSWLTLAFLDIHEPGRAETFCPPHCERGSG